MKRDGEITPLFLRDDGLLVGYLETEDFERARAGMARREVNERWQREMGDFFVQPDGACRIAPCGRLKKSSTYDSHSGAE